MLHRPSEFTTFVRTWGTMQRVSEALITQTLERIEVELRGFFVPAFAPDKKSRSSRLAVTKSALRGSSYDPCHIALARACVAPHWEQVLHLMLKTGRAERRDQA